MTGAATAMSTSAQVCGFWRQSGRERWFAKDAAFDRQFVTRFGADHFAAARRERDDWAQSAEGALALMVLLDQLPRNAWRGTGHMYATDPLARMFARQALAAQFDRQVEAEIRVFFYLPFMHSEDIADQDLAAACCAHLGGDHAAHAVGHREVIERFGRFPHRNAMLGRATTPEEEAFLSSGGFAG